MLKIFKKKQTNFCYCPKCSNELISSDSLILDSVWTYFKCSKCGLITRWDFDLPVPVLLEEVNELKETQEMLKHNKDRHYIKVQLIKYINKYSKKEVQEIVDEIRGK